MKPRTRRIISFAALTLGGIVVGLIFSFYLMLRLSVPPIKGKLALQGLSEPVEISYDALGVAQVWAKNAQDAYFALGYLHASDRLFQMDLTRRIATGRLSELIGRATLSLDKEQRLMGHLRAAIEAESQLSDKSRSLLQAYTDGVNAYVESSSALPFEYRFLPIGFVKWKLTDCLAILSFETWFSNALMNRDEFYQDLAAKVGTKKAESLIFPYPDWAPSTVADSSASSAIAWISRPDRENKRHSGSVGSVKSVDLQSIPAELSGRDREGSFPRIDDVQLIERLGGGTFTKRERERNALFRPSSGADPSPSVLVSGRNPYRGFIGKCSRYHRGRSALLCDGTQRSRSLGVYSRGSRCSSLRSNHAESP